jgi:hypothetical protein
MEANWKPGVWYDGKEEVIIPVGSFITSFRKMAKECNLSLKQVRSAAERLQNMEVAHFTTNKSRNARNGAQGGAQTRAQEGTRIDVLNYLQYQTVTETDEDEGHKLGTSLGTSLGTRGGTSGAQVGVQVGVANGTQNGLSSNEINEPSNSEKRPHKEEDLKNIRSKDKSGSLSVVKFGPKDLDVRSAELYRNHPIAASKDLAELKLLEILQKAEDQEALLSKIELNHQIWIEYWDNQPPGEKRIPGLLKWFADEYYEKTPPGYRKRKPIAPAAEISSDPDDIPISPEERLRRLGLETLKLKAAGNG